LIEAGWPARLVQSFGPAKLFLVFELSQQRRARLELRALVNATAAAAGGEAAQKRYRQIEKELRGNKSAQRADGSGIPLSQEDFERMMQEETE